MFIGHKLFFTGVIIYLHGHIFFATSETHNIFYKGDIILGRKKNVEKKKRETGIQIPMPDDKREALHALAKENGQSLNSFTRNILYSKLKEAQKANP